MKRIKIENGLIDDNRRIMIFMDYDYEIKQFLKSIPGAIWDPYIRCWHVLETDENLKMIVQKIQEREDVDLVIYTPKIKQISKGNKTKPNVSFPLLEKEDIELINELKSWMRFRRYSESTVRTYSDMTGLFLRFIKPKRAFDELGNNLQRFVNEYILPKKLSESFQNQLVNALKLFYGQIMKQELVYEQVRRPRREFKLPNVLSKEEVKRILEALINLKHRAMLSTIYACGLRSGELLKLKPADIDSERGLLIIRQAKGKKDRIVPLPFAIIGLLREYYKLYKPKVWLFEGIRKGEQYDERSLQEVLKKAILLVRIKKPVTLHWLRHSYATHLHETGVDILFIQQLLGHKSTKTTQIYTHVSKKSLHNIRSPFEDL